MAAPRLLSCLLLGLALVALAGGCDSSFEPYAETERAFSLFGVVDVQNQRHAVRVEPLQDREPLTSGPELDATATLTNVETGREVALQLQRSPRRGGFQYEFIARLKPRLATTYRLDVNRSDGNATSATLTTPNQIPELSVVSREEDGDASPEIFALVDRILEDRLLFLTVYYRLLLERQGAPGVPPPPPVEQTYEVEYGGRVAATPSGYNVQVEWETDLEAFRRNLGEGIPTTLLSIEATAASVHPSAPAYDGIAYEDLFRIGADPSNVENGYGYVAGTARDTARLQIEGNPNFPDVSF